MAPRITTPTKRQQDQTRAAIQTTKLIKRLQCHALGEKWPNKKGAADAEMDSTRLKAIEILLRKALPDLSAVDMNTTHEVSDPLADLIKQIQNRGQSDT